MHCSLWITHRVKSLPNQQLYYKRPLALGITKHLSCWPPSTSLAWDLCSINSRYNRRASLCLNCSYIAGNVTSVINTNDIDNLDSWCAFQGHVYSLIGAVGDNRFALMHAGYKHTHGIDGFPKDLDMAYSYYSNAGAQSSIDFSRIHDQKVCLDLWNQ